jgi:integrase
MAFRDSTILEDGGPGAVWSEGSRRSVRHSYRRWLGFLATHEPDALDLDPVVRVTEDRIRRYVDALQGSISPAGTHNYVKHLYDALRVMAPGHGWSWLERLARSLSRLVTPRSKRHRVVSAHALVALGIDLMEQAEHGDTMTGNPALLYRDGLIIALLAARPIRRRNLAMMRIGRHLLRDRVGYRLAFNDDETKSGMPLHLDLPQFLIPFIDAYLDRWRPAIAGAEGHDGLWASMKGCPMSGDALYDRVCIRTARAFGHAVNLHLFRDCVATTIALEDPANVGIAAELLGHASLAMTERHYIQASTVEATRRHQQGMLDARSRFRAQRRSTG